VSCGAAGRGGDGVELFGDGLAPHSCAAPGEESPPRDLWPTLSDAGLCLRGKTAKKPVILGPFPLFGLFNEAEQKPCGRARSVGSACGDFVMPSLGTKFPLG